MSSLYPMLFGLGVILSVIAIVIGIMFSRYLEIHDHPDEHKQHAVSTPFIGGLGIIVACCVVFKTAYHHQLVSSAAALAMVSGAMIVFLTGFADDLWRLGYKIRFVIEALAVCLMIYAGGVVLTDLGQVVPGVTLGLGYLAIPFTIFATVGVINALNMIDGIDGLSGSIALVSLIMLAIVALSAGQSQSDYFVLITALLAGVVGFLGFNLRCFRRPRALVFLGDNGSMLLGFMLAWLFIGLSQQPVSAMTPVTALWLFAVPLIDTVTVMIRRIWLGRSPFHPDRFHLHHLLLRAGFRTADAVLVIVALHALLGIVGLAGLYLGVWEPLMFAAFLAIAIGYMYAASRPWRCIPALCRLHTGLGLMKADCQGCFIGYFTLEEARRVLSALHDETLAEYEYDLRVYQLLLDQAEPVFYAVLETGLAEDNRAELDLKEMVADLKQRLGAAFPELNLQVRQYVRRDPSRDRRMGQKSSAQELRLGDRRDAADKILWQTDYFLNRSLSCHVEFVDDGEKKPAPKELAPETK